mgnify:FL=1
MTSTLTVQQVTGWSARITYTRDPGDDIGKADTVTLYRVSPDGGSGVVIGARRAPNASTSWDDPETLLGAMTSWKLAGNNAAAIETAKTVIEAPAVAGMGGRPGPVLSDPYRGITVPCVAGVEILTTKRASRSTALNIEGRQSRIVVSDVEGWPTASPKFITETLAAAERLDELFAPGHPVLLRAPGLLVPDGWMYALGDRTAEPFGDPSAGRVMHTISQTEQLEQAPYPDRRPAGDTLGDLHAAIPGALADIAAGWVTLGDIAATDLKAMV